MGGDAQPIIVLADALRLEQVIQNLISNAVKYSPDGGTIEVEIARRNGAGSVTVADHGIGIPARDLPRVFERFFQVESHLTRRYGGMGLGLAVAKAMIELHGGRIWAESAQGK